MEQPRVLAVDGNSLLHRSFHSQASSGLRGADGEPIWAVRGVVSQLVAAVERVDPDAVVVGFDDPNQSDRRSRWPQYKATRAEKAPALTSQLRLCAETLDQLGFNVVVPAGLEADDVLASTAARTAEAGGHCVVMTSDRDSFALINQSTTVLRILNGGIEASPMLTPARLELMLGIHPSQYRDYAALRGDASDNLAGVSGIGAKTAAKLLRTVASVSAAFDDISAGGKKVTAAIGPKAAARLAAVGARDSWELNCAVMTMRTDLAIDLACGQLPLRPEALRDVFERLALTWTLPKALRLLARAPEAPLSETLAHTSYADTASRPPYADRALRNPPGIDSTGWSESQAARRRQPDRGGRAGGGDRGPGDSRGGGRRAHPPLPRREHPSDQLSLF